MKPHEFTQEELDFYILAGEVTQILPRVYTHDERDLPEYELRFGDRGREYVYISTPRQLGQVLLGLYYSGEYEVLGKLINSKMGWSGDVRLPTTTFWRDFEFSIADAIRTYDELPRRVVLHFFLWSKS